MLNGAWNDVTKDTIRNCFRHAGLCMENDEAPIPAETAEDGDIAELWEELGCLAGAVPDGVGLDDFVMIDDDIAVGETPSDKDIAADVATAAATDDAEEAGNSESEEPPRPTLHEALSAVDGLRRYCSGIEGSGLEFARAVSCVENGILVDAGKAKSQAKITACCA
ncbi:hypothetical protein HPB47_002782 [Ixodes persulcatus]|uniref:Uncharacterized protein n=1 Tax=Ixodes persulcatus TaxID=34615 RepID=A0AC60PLF3_IXOPE|nr:hypothetical protein HPB47_002782 [Ixodes persulcatus]